MINSIKYFEKKCISRFEKLEDEFMKEPTRLAKYVYGLTDELHRLGLEMIKESLESMDRMFQKIPVRLEHWVVEAHKDKQLTTSLGNVVFSKTLFTSRETGKSEYLLDRILGLKPNERITEDAQAKMLKLVRYQKRQMPKACGAEYDVLSSAQILVSERNRHGELGKYVETYCVYVSTYLPSFPYVFVLLSFLHSPIFNATSLFSHS